MWPPRRKEATASSPTKAKPGQRGAPSTKEETVCKRPARFAIEPLRLEAEFRETAQGEFRALQPREAELRERLRVIETQAGRLVLRAPVSGAVLGLQALAVGG